MMLDLFKSFPYLGLAYRFPTLYRLLPGEFPYYFTLAELDQMVALQQLPPGALVLDIGCGEGVMALHLARQRDDLYILGIDNSAEMLHTATEQAESAGFTHCAFVLQDSDQLSQSVIDGYCRQHHFPIQAPMLITAILSFSAMAHYARVIDQLVTLLPANGVLFTLDMWRRRTPLNYIGHFLCENLLVAANSFRPIQQHLANRLTDCRSVEKKIRDDITGIGTMEPFMFRGRRQS